MRIPALGPPASAGTFALLAVLFVVGACGDQVQKAKPPERPAEPAMPADHPTIGHGGVPPGHGATRPAPADPFADAGAASKPVMSAPKPADPGKVVFAGEVTIDPAVPLGEKYVVYLSAIFGPQERAPVYIKRYESPKFPIRFEMTEGDAGMGARPDKSEKPLYLRAMISDTGDPMKTRNRTVSESAFPIGTKDVKLTIKP